MDHSLSMPHSKRNDLLKIFAMLTMLIDHSGAILFPQYRILRTIGRLAFPVFCYQLSVGYTKTSDVEKYTLRLFEFGFLAQLPYWYLNHSLTIERPLVFNVMFLLAVGVFMLRAFDGFKEAFLKKSLWALPLFLLFLLILISPNLVALMVPGFGLSYGSYGLLLIFGFYLFKDNLLKMVPYYIAVTLLCNYVDVAEYAASGEYHLKDRFRVFFQMIQNPSLIFGAWAKYWRGFLTGYFFQARSIFSLLFIWGLNKINVPIRLNKYVGYWFYPVHIALLELIAYFFFKIR